MIELSVILPAFNEAADIQRNALLIQQKLRSLKVAHEIILVNDGSTDNTLECMRQLPADTFKILSYERNAGKGHAVRLGMLQARGRFHLFMDVDLSTSLDAVDVFLAAMRTGQYDVLLGERKSHFHSQKIRQPLHREILGKFFLLLSKVCVGRNIKDFTCGFKMFTAAASTDIFSRQVIDKWAYDTEIIGIAIARDLRIGELPVIWNHHESSQVRALRDTATSLRDLVRIKCNLIKGQYLG